MCLGFLPGSHLEGKIVSGRQASSEKAALPDHQVGEAGVSAVVSAAKDSDSALAGPRWTHLQKAALKLPQETKDCPCTAGSESEGRNQQHQGNADTSLGLGRDLLLSSRSAVAKGLMGPSSSSGKSSCQPEGLHSDSADKLTVFGHASKLGVKEFEGPPLPLEGKPEAKQGWVTPGRNPALGKSCSSPAPDNCVLETEDRGCTGNVPESRLKSNANNCFQVPQHSEQPEPSAVAGSLGQKEEEQQQRVTEATVCAKNSKVSSTGEKVVLWTRYVCLNCGFAPSCTQHPASGFILQSSLYFRFVSPFSDVFCHLPANTPAWFPPATICHSCRLGPVRISVCSRQRNCCTTSGWRGNFLLFLQKA